MSREFNNGVTTDLMTYALSAGVGPENFVYGTQLVLVRIMAANDTWVSMIEGNQPTTGEYFAIGRRLNNGLYTSNGATVQDSSESGSGTPFTITSADNWSLYVQTKASGTVSPTYHKYPVGGSRTTNQITATFADSVPNAVSITLGGPEDPAHIRFAVAAVLHGIVLTAGQIDAIMAALTTQSILDLCDSNSWVVDDSDGFANNLANNHSHRSAINGTTDNGDDPAGWVYGLGASSQKGYAVADSVDNGWTDQAAGTSLAAAIDETSPSDADYIQSPLSPSNSGTRIKAFNSLVTPQSGTRTLRWRTAKDSAAGATINMTIKLYQGGGDSLGAGTLVDSFSRNGVSNTPTTFDETVTGTITDYDDLYVEFWANQP